MSQSFGFEVAVYTVAEPTTFDARQKQAHGRLSEFAGFVHGVALRGLEDPGLRADLILWGSLEAAQEASQAIEKDGRFGPFMAAIAKINHFDHYRLVGEPRPELLEGVPLVEVAVYGTHASVPMLELQAGVHKALEGVEGASPWTRGAGVKDAGVLLDVIGWSDAAVHRAAPGVLQQRYPELAPFFTGVESMHVFELFEVVL